MTFVSDPGVEQQEMSADEAVPICLSRASRSFVPVELVGRLLGTSESNIT